MDYSAILGQATAYVQKFIDAAIPVAKQAYEIGLLTLQIDALSILVPALLGLIVSGIVLWKCKSIWRNAKKLAKENKVRDYWGKLDPAKAAGLAADGMGLAVTGLAALIVFVVSTVHLCNMWLWVKLFKPELWLAKQAIEAVLNAAGTK